MASTPIPLTTDGTGPEGAIPVTISGLPGSGALDPVLQALVDAGFGQSGQVLQTNSSGDGFEWVAIPSGL